MDFPTLSYTGSDGQHIFPLKSASTSIGRSPGQDIVLLDPFVSRQHAAIVLEEGTYAIVDRNSSHGTFVNGERVRRAALNSGDLLQLGSLEGPRLRFQFEVAHEQEPTARRSMVTSLLSSFSEFPLGDEKHRPAAQEMEQLNWLLSAARQLNAGGAIEDILTTLLQLTLQLTGVERGFVFLREGGEMKLARGLNAEGRFVHISDAHRGVGGNGIEPFAPPLQPDAAPAIPR